MAAVCRRRESGLFFSGEWRSVEREDIKRAVPARTIRLVVATDATCEGLNLQTLGALINIDLPWNTSRLQQRIGRIQRFTQTRDRVDMLTLVAKIPAMRRSTRLYRNGCGIATIFSARYPT